MENSQINGRNHGRITPAACLLVIAVVSIGGGIWLYFDRPKTGRERPNLRTAVGEELAILHESAKVQDAATHDKLLTQMKEHLESSASDLDNANAAASRAMASFAGKFQAKRRDYDAALARVTQEKVLSFQIHDRPTIESHRTVLRAFLAANQRLGDFQANAEGLMRAELETANVPSLVRDQTLIAFMKSQNITRAVMTRLRQSDQATGEAGLAALDVLDQNWGKWRLDEATMRMISENTETITSYKASIQKLVAAQRDHENAKQELAELVNAGRRALDEQAKAAFGN